MATTERWVGHSNPQHFAVSNPVLVASVRIQWAFRKKVSRTSVSTHLKIQHHDCICHPLIWRNFTSERQFVLQFQFLNQALLWEKDVASFDCLWISFYESGPDKGTLQHSQKNKTARHSHAAQVPLGVVSKNRRVTKRMFRRFILLALSLSSTELIAGLSQPEGLYVTHKFLSGADFQVRGLINHHCVGRRSNQV